MGNKPSRIMKDSVQDSRKEQKDNQKGRGRVNPKSREMPTYTREKDEKGFVLIINYMFLGKSGERDGSEKDVKKLQTFFGDKNYEIDVRSDMGTQELRNYLKSVRDNQLDTPESKYHCFFCIIMSHGNESDVDTTDSSMSRNEIVNMFRNNELSYFIGKPKIFMFQTCRGGQIQRKHGNDGSRLKTHRDHSNLSISLPTDADIMLIFATTHGYFSYRTTNGSWLIKAFLEAANEFPDCHISEIMTKVKYELAHNTEYEDGEECQIPASEDTLTKLFYL